MNVLIDTAYRRVVPLYSFDKGGRPYLIGSSVPFQSGSLSFEITAAHCCFRDGKPLPLFAYGEKRPQPLTGLRIAWEYQSGQQPDVDIAVIGLNQDSAEDLRDQHWFTTPDDVSVTTSKASGAHYLMVGYPVSRNRKRPIHVGLPSRATALITGDIGEVKTVRGIDKMHEYHFAIAFPHEKVLRPGGGEFQVPPPHGMSGGGVWRVEIDKVGQLANTPTLVGIIIEYHSAQKTFIATRVQAAAPLARDLADHTAS